MDLDGFLGDVAKSTQHKHLYHFTDRKNVPSIRQHGLLSTAELKRRGLFTGVTPGGDANSQASDHATGTDRYVCLCFTSDHPMCYRAQTDGRNLDPVYLKINPAIIKRAGVMITNAPSNQNGVERVAAATALDGLDLQVIYTWMEWKDPAINSRLQVAKKYEILIPTQVEIDQIVEGL